MRWMNDGERERERNVKRGEKKRREAPKNNIVKPHDNDDGLSTRVHTYTCVHIYTLGLIRTLVHIL